MQATDILQNEHRVIEQVLSCLEKIADQAEVAGRLDPEPAELALDFFRHFADECHHGKEESCLFPLMEARGFPREGGPTGVMLHEHEQGRLLIRGMTESVPAATTGNAVAVRRFTGHARAYADLLRNHIVKEDQRLFPMADQVLSREDQEQLLAKFARVERHDMGEETHEKYVAIANALAERFQTPRALPLVAAGAACGCGH